MLVIIYRCHDCMHINKQELGMPGFEFIEYTWTAFSDAHRHMIQHPYHWIDSIVQQSGDDE